MAPASRIEIVPLTAAVGRSCANPTVTGNGERAAFSNSAMDGFAIRSSDLPGTLRIFGEVAAGAGRFPEVSCRDRGPDLDRAPIPPGADAVVPIERATESGGEVQIPGLSPR